MNKSRFPVMTVFYYTILLLVFEYFIMEAKERNIHNKYISKIEQLECDIKERDLKIIEMSKENFELRINNERDARESN
jgi:hypothetical protein